ncbi:MAG: hypothetical protein U5J78_06910 [Parasphingorhabdus sp.]|nr:hypothetical protein [Parasphingorhabdus sp.]
MFAQTVVENTMKLILPAFAIAAMMVAPAYAASKDAADTTAAAKPVKITDRNHPDYVRCRSEKVIGSLAKRNRVCLTNREWAAVIREGNRLAREMVESNTGNPSGQ